MKIDLHGQVALVTGSTRGIGRAVAQSLDQSGARVAVHGHKNISLAQKVSQGFTQSGRAYKADLAQIDECEALMHQVIDDFGRLDILINNAGIAQFVDVNASMKVWTDTWKKTMAVNARAPAALCKLAIKQFQYQGGGRIINIASRAAFRGDTAEYMMYAASKGAVVSLTRSIARAYGKDGVKAFIVAPGFVRTDMAQDAVDAYGEDFIVQDLALNQLTEPDDVAPMVTLLASGLADHATGTSIDINAGSYVH